MSLSTPLPGTIVDVGRFRCLLLSSTNISKFPTNQAERPTKDFELLSKRFNVGVVDVENYREHESLGLKLAAKAGLSWEIAAAAMRHAHEYNAVLAMSDDVGVTMAVLMQFARRRVPIFIITQHLRSRRPALFIGKLHMTGAIAKFLCLVPQQIDLLRDHYQVDPAKIELINYHVDHRFYRPMPEVEVKRQICSAGMTSRDYATLLKATRGMGVPVRIEARSEWLEGKLNFTQSDLHDQVEMCNYGTSAGLRSLYAESEIVVVPLQNVPVVAGFSTLLEGMAMGKPVIASRISMIGSFIQDGVNGLLVKPEDPADLREKLTYLLDHPEEARRLGERARQSIEQNFTLDDYVEHIYSTIINSVTQR